MFNLKIKKYFIKYNDYKSIINIVKESYKQKKVKRV